MYGYSSSSFDFCHSNGVNLIEPNTVRGVQYAQYFRANLRQVNHPHMFLDNAILAEGLEEYKEYDISSIEKEPQIPQPSPPYDQLCFCCYSPEKYMEEHDLEDGMISPLELPPRLLNFGTSDGGSSASMLMDSEPPLDLEELDRRLELVAHVERPEDVDLSNIDRRLESIARIERLEKAGLLNAFFAFASATHA